MTFPDKHSEPNINRFFLLGLIIILFLVAFVVRLYDLDDPPLDFHSTRQLRSLIIARGMYFDGWENAPALQQAVAVDQWKAFQVIEPPLFERMVAFTYRVLGQEISYIGRIYSTLFWLLGGIPLFLLARRMSNTAGGLLALAYYLCLPFGIIASRSFQPDPLMVCLVIYSWWAFDRWFYKPAWGSTILAGLLIGMAIFVKSVAVLVLFGGILGVIIAEKRFLATLKDIRAWVLAGLSVLPTLIFMIYGFLALNISSQFEGRFFPEMLIDPSHYVRWLFYAADIVGFAALIGGLMGILLLRKRKDRAFILGLWIGYIIYGLLFPYHFLTHNYYHLPLIPLIALSIAPLGETIYARLWDINPGRMSQAIAVGILLLAAVIQAWDARVTLAQEDYRNEPPYWQAIGEVVDLEAEVVALSQDYGNRIAYYGGVDTTNWPGTGQQDYRDLRGGRSLTFEEQLEKYTEGQDLFLVTRLKEFRDQSDLYDHLSTNYPVIAEGQGYLIYDLNNPLP